MAALRHDGKWACEIIALQNEDGTWGEMFHALSVPAKRYPLTTEQALRRLWVLGYAIEDEPIRKAVDYMKACLRGERKVDDYAEKGFDWPWFQRFMLSTWVRIFEPENELAGSFARQWGEIIEKAFERGAYDKEAYIAAFVAQFSPGRGKRIPEFHNFYALNLLPGVLTARTESLLLDSILSWPGGIYYIYEKTLADLPEVFASKATSHYLNALEILARYGSAVEKLGFTVDWINAHRDENGQWDLGAKASDGVYFPLSDSWRRVEDRKADCTEQINRLLRRISHTWTN